MKLSETRKVTAVFTALQAATLIAGALGTFFAYLAGCYGLFFSSMALDGGEARGIAACVVGFAVLLVVSAMCWAALIAFFRMCGRLKKERVFTEVNERALRRIARCFALCAASLAVGVPVIALLREIILATMELMVLAFLFLFLALIVQALALLVRRAELLQSENDLTV